MRNLNGHPVRRGAVGVLAGTLAFTGGAFAAGLSPVNAVEGFAFEERLAGTDRYGTAAEIATDTFASADTVVLARGDSFADALTGNYLAGARSAPILLTRTGDVPDATAEALVALGAENIIIVGGTDAVSQAVEDELDDDYTVDRFGGEDRYETANLIAAEAAGDGSGVGEFNGLRTAVLGTGLNFPDVLAAGPLGFAEQFPIMLTMPDELPDETVDVISDLNIEQVIVVGGTAAVSVDVREEVEDLTGNDVIVLADVNRAGTAVAIANFAYDELDFDDTHVNLARSDDFADALAGGPHGGVDPAPIVISDPLILQPETAALLDARCETLVDGHIFGGTAAISTAVEDLAEAAAACEGPTPGPGPGPITGNQDFSVDPGAGDPQLVDPGADTISRFTYTFSGLPENVDATLVPCFFVNVDAAGNVTFADDPIEGDGTFDPDDNDNRLLEDNSPEVDNSEDDTLGTTYDNNSFFVFANGELDTDGEIVYLDDIATDDGVLVLEVFSQEGDCFVPVVFDDAAQDDTLQLDENDQPITPFAIGGAGVPTRGEAPSGTEVDGEVIFVDKDADFFVLDDGLQYFYGDEDTFSYAGDSGLFDANDSFDIPLAEFELYLSEGDVLEDADVSQYSRTGRSEFEFAVDVANTPGTPDVALGDFDDDASDDNNNDVRVTWTAPDPVDGLINDYQVERYQLTGGEYVSDGVLFDSDDDPDPFLNEQLPAPNQDLNNDNIDDDVDLEVIDENVGDGTFVYVITALTATGDTSLYSSNPSDTVQPEAIEGAPRTTSVTGTDIGTVGLLTPGDTITLNFDQPVTAPDAGDSITLTDADGTVVRLTNGLNGTTFTATDADTIVVLVGDPEVRATGTTAGAQFPLNIVDSSGVTDVDQGLELDVSNSPDTQVG